MRVLTLIPARGGSVRVPRKNLQLVGGVTLLMRAVRCGGAPVVVSTDDDEIARTVVPRDVTVLRRRCGPDGPMIDVVLDALDQLDAPGLLFDALVLLQPSSPLRTRGDVQAFVAAAATHTSMVSVGPDGRRDGHAYWATVEFLRTHRALWLPDTPRWETPPARSLDVNTVAELAEARRRWAEATGA